MTEKIPADTKIDVLVGKSLKAAIEEGLQGPAVLITPDRDDWNDYGYRQFAKLYVIDDQGTTTEKHLRIMFEGDTQTARFLRNWLEKHGPLFPIQNIDVPYVSLIPELEFYGEFIQILGFQKGVSALRILGDAIVVQLENTDNSRLTLIASEAFHTGIMRHSGAYSALRRGGRYFRDGMPESMDEMAVSFEFSAILDHIEKWYDLSFDFEGDEWIRDRIAVLIGKNGVGKTQLLKAMVDSFTYAYDHASLAEAPSFDPEISPRRVLVFSSVSTDPFPHRLGAWKGIDYEYFPVNHAGTERPDPLLASLVACKYQTDEGAIELEEGLSRIKIVKAAAKKLGLWDGLCFPLKKPSDRENIPRVLLVEDQHYVQIKTAMNEQAKLWVQHRIDWEKNIAVVNPDETVRALSSGEHAMLRFTGQAASAIERGSLVLIDEPETHLHPNYISDLIEILSDILKATNSVAIIATHSPYIVREVTKENVQVISVKEDEISIDAPRMETFGGSIDKISQFVFGDTNIDHHFQRTLITIADEYGMEHGIEGVLEEFGDSLNSESLSFIARRIRENLKLLES